MELGLVAKTSRNVCIELKDTGIFYTDVNNYDIYINGVYTQSTNRVITSIYGLLPDTNYNIEVVESADRRSTRLNSSHNVISRMPSSA